ncbi:MAG: hypothetical protein CVV07_07220 [Gammaproteobacteria bacterium HGW-Gammaproteobacteria-11]|nr:MAG: hypothetical protein CVV07_07220 [Gammaproteobacteria bacterium HGW-Gammaproteobacteria-11]
MKYQPDMYLTWDPFEGDMDVDIRCRKVKLVRVRKAHVCHLSMGGPEPEHEIQPGEMARHESAFVDGSHWGSYYACIPCMDAWFDELNYDLHGDDMDELEPKEPEGMPYRCELTPDMFGGTA